MGKEKRLNRIQYASVPANLASGLNVQQQVVDDVQDHSVLNWIRGNLQVMVNESESFHST